MPSAVVQLQHQSMILEALLTNNQVAEQDQPKDLRSWSRQSTTDTIGSLSGVHDPDVVSHTSPVAAKATWKQDARLPWLQDHTRSFAYAPSSLQDSVSDVLQADKGHRGFDPLDPAIYDSNHSSLGVDFVEPFVECATTSSASLAKQIDQDGAYTKWLKRREQRETAREMARLAKFSPCSSQSNNDFGSWRFDSLDYGRSQRMPHGSFSSFEGVELFTECASPISTSTDNVFDGSGSEVEPGSPTGAADMSAMIAWEMRRFERGKRRSEKRMSYGKLLRNTAANTSTLTPVTSHQVAQS